MHALAERSDHFDGRRFFNPNGPHLQPFSAVLRMLRERRRPWPPLPVQPSRQPIALGDARAVVTFIGHATVLIQTPAGNILTDPMYSQRAGPFNMAGPGRMQQPGIALRDLPPISLVLLSHNHYDHCDISTLRALARRFDPVVITPIGNGRLVRSAGIRRVEELDWWQHAQVSDLSVTVTPAFHFSARGLFDRNRALWGGFLLTVNQTRMYFAGDTAYGPFFQEIRQRCGHIDVALIPIGAYEPRWFMKSVHINPAEAVRAHMDLMAAKSIAIHFGTFQLTTEGFDEPVRALAEARGAEGIAPEAFIAPGLGESFRVT